MLQKSSKIVCQADQRFLAFLHSSLRRHPYLTFELRAVLYLSQTNPESARLIQVRKCVVLTLVFLAVVPVLAKDDEAKIKAAVTERYQLWIAAENKKDAEAITDFYDEHAVLMPKQEEPVIGKAAIGEYYKKLVADPHFAPFILISRSKRQISTAS